MAASSTLLHGVCADIAAAGSVSDELWKVLAFICPEALQGAAEILDHRSLQGAHPHVSLPGFCTCGAYCHKVAARPDSIACKHELAALLATALGKCERVDKADAAWANELENRLQMAMLAHGA